MGARLDTPLEQWRGPEVVHEEIEARRQTLPSKWGRSEGLQACQIRRGRRRNSTCSCERKKSAPGQIRRLQDCLNLCCVQSFLGRHIFEGSLDCDA